MWTKFGLENDASELWEMLSISLFYQIAIYVQSMQNIAIIIEYMNMHMRISATYLNFWRWYYKYVLKCLDK